MPTVLEIQYTTADLLPPALSGPPPGGNYIVNFGAADPSGIIASYVIIRIYGKAYGVAADVHGGRVSVTVFMVATNNDAYLISADQIMPFNGTIMDLQTMVPRAGYTLLSVNQYSLAGTVTPLTAPVEGAPYDVEVDYNETIYVNAVGLGDDPRVAPIATKCQNVVALIVASGTSSDNPLNNRFLVFDATVANTSHA